jgi:hypothetical protein
MASQQQHAPGGHYSGHNPIPTVKQFIENLDKDKAERDRQIDQQAREGKGQTPGQKGLATSTGRDVTASSGAEPHKMQKRSVEGTEQTVTDPVTGNQVTISDVDKSMMNEVENPHVVIPNANLNKDTVGTLIQKLRKLANTSQPIKTDANQSLEDYKYNQDVTAPPDPVAEGTTSDVPIHGEKTNVLFHPTPSVSYEPTFAALEKRAGILCVGLLVATIVVGKLFGGALKGLIPLGMCLSSGVWLWTKEVVRSGREVEWESEATRGQMVNTILLGCTGLH